MRKSILNFTIVIITAVLWLTSCNRPESISEPANDEANQFSPLNKSTRALAWNFNTNTEGWVLNSSLTGSVTAGILNLRFNGADPFMVSANNLNISATSLDQLEITMQNLSPVTRFQLFWITTTDGNWNQEKSVWLDVSGNDVSQKQYTINLLQNSLWKGTIRQIRLDVGDNIGAVIKLDKIQLNKIVQTPEFTWDFNTNSEGWVLNSSLSGSVSSGIYNLTVTGPDPFMVSSGNFNINAAVLNQLELTMQNISPVTRFQLFWITITDGNWNQEKSIWIDVSGYDNTQKQYKTFLQKNSLWKGTVRQIRLDIGDNIGAVVKLDKIKLSNVNFSIDNGTIILKQDLMRGGAISYISKSGSTRNIVNVHDEGRYIQQSYYVGNSVNRIPEGQHPAWSPWPWNPIQVGDAFGNRAQILDYNKSGNSTYVKCIPMQWDMNNRPSEAEMEQWTEVVGNVIKVRNRLTCHRTDNVYGEGTVNHQEVPAVYPISALKNLFSYFGNAPFTNAPLSNPPVVNLSSGFWGRYLNGMVTESWMAFVDDSHWGLGVYTPITKDFIAGMSGNSGYESTDGSTSYIAPVKSEIFYKNTVYDYTYYLVIGNLTQIRSSIYQIRNRNLKQSRNSIR